MSTDFKSSQKIEKNVFDLNKKIGPNPLKIPQIESKSELNRNLNLSKSSFNRGSILLMDFKLDTFCHSILMSDFKSDSLMRFGMANQIGLHTPVLGNIDTVYFSNFF